MGVQVNLEELRGYLPEWSWRATREGLGWRYEGFKDGERATIQRTSMMVGEDQYKTFWIVYETGESYTAWSVRERIRLGDRPEEV